MFDSRLRGMSHLRKRQSGFTLAELLIALAILGVIATFTIPKVMTAQANGQNTAIVKESAAMLTGALEQAANAGTLSANTKLIDLTPYINYTTTDTSGATLDGIPSIANITCNASHPCIRLHNGAALGTYDANEKFGGTATTNCLEAYIDPNGVQDTSSTSDGSNKAVSVLLYYNNFMTTRDTPLSGSVSSTATKSPQTYYKPAWFNWQ